MTKKIYDSKAEAMEAAEGFVKTLSNVFMWEIEEHPSMDNIIGVTYPGSGDRYIRIFEYKTAPKGTRGYAWNGSGPRPANAPIYTATGEVDYKGKVFVTSINGERSMSVDNFEPIEPDTELETAVGRIVDWLEDNEEFTACENLSCLDDCNVSPKTSTNAGCRSAQIANLVRIGWGEGC